MIVNHDDIDIILYTATDIAQGDDKHELYLITTALNNLMMDDPVQDVIESIASAEQRYWEWYRPEVILKLQGDLWMRPFPDQYSRQVNSAREKALKNQDIVKSRSQINRIDAPSPIQEDKQTFGSAFKEIKPPNDNTFY